MVSINSVTAFYVGKKDQAVLCFFFKMNPIIYFAFKIPKICLLPSIPFKWIKTRENLFIGQILDYYGKALLNQD